jgi:hypothetical protein
MSWNGVGKERGAYNFMDGMMRIEMVIKNFATY